MVVSCDTVTNVDLFTMLDLFRKNDASIVMQLFKGCLEADVVVPGPKAKHKQGKCAEKIKCFSRALYS